MVYLFASGQCLYSSIYIVRFLAINDLFTANIIHQSGQFRNQSGGMVFCFLDFFI